MKTIKKNVYYCDHCNKRTLSASSIIKHEKHCTANPKRECRLCDRKDGIEEIITDFKKRFVISKADEEKEMRTHTVTWIGEPITFKEIRDAGKDCPNCILAIIRQCKFGHHYFDELVKEFDYKKEFDEAVAHRNREDLIHDYYNNTW